MVPLQRKHHLNRADVGGYTQLVAALTEISPMREMIYMRQLRWLGHVRRMPQDRLPRRLLTSWVCNPRTQGGQEMNYGRTVDKALYWAGIDCLEAINH